MQALHIADRLDLALNRVLARMILSIPIAGMLGSTSIDMVLVKGLDTATGVGHDIGVCPEADPYPAVESNTDA